MEGWGAFRDGWRAPVPDAPGTTAPSLPWAATTRSAASAPDYGASINPAVLALRWGAVGFGLLFAAPAAFRGSYAAVLATAVCLFVTTYRTMVPVRPGATDWRSTVTPFVDVVAVAAVVGADGGVESPYFFVLLATILVVTLGWGGWRGLAAAALGVAVLVVCTPVGRVDLGGQFDSRRDLAALMVVVLAVAGAAFLKARLEEADRGRSELTDEVTRLSEANDLLVSLTQAARSLPGSLSLRDTVEQARLQLRRDLEVDTVVLLTWDEPTEEWTTRIADGCVLPSALGAGDLPAALAAALRATAPVVVDHRAQPDAPPPLQADRSSGVYVPISSRGRIVGVLGMEHPVGGHFDERRLILLSGLTDVLGLGIDNARWFARLRTLGAEEERSRIARELHDRLGQWLTYISMELERIGGSTASEQVVQLRGDVNSAIDDLRYTLSDLRANIDETHPLAVRGAEMTSRFTQRTGTPATFSAPDGPARVAAPVETELLRILQEALTNVDRHARATSVQVRWVVGGGDYELTVVDDGRGFDPEASTRDSAYGLVGMRERVDVIGAHLRIESTPSGGTTVRVSAGPPARGDQAAGRDQPLGAAGDGTADRELRP